jgi:hypothetical protein
VCCWRDGVVGGAGEWVGRRFDVRVLARGKFAGGASTTALTWVVPANGGLEI